MRIGVPHRRRRGSPRRGAKKTLCSCGTACTGAPQEAVHLFPRGAPSAEEGDLGGGAGDDADLHAGEALPGARGEGVPGGALDQLVDQRVRDVAVLHRHRLVGVGALEAEPAGARLDGVAHPGGDQLHRVAVVPGLGGRDGGHEGRVGELAQAGQLIAQDIRLELQLGLVGGVLPVAAPADAEDGAGGGLPRRGGLEDGGDPPPHVAGAGLGHVQR